MNLCKEAVCEVAKLMSSKKEFNDGSTVTDPSANNRAVSLQRHQALLKILGVLTPCAASQRPINTDCCRPTSPKLRCVEH